MSWMQEFDRGGLERRETPDPGDPAYLDHLVDQMEQERLLDRLASGLDVPKEIFGDDPVPKGVVVHWHAPRNDPTNMGGTILPARPMDPLEVTRAGAHEEIEIIIQHDRPDPMGGVVNATPVSRTIPPHKVIVRTKSGQQIITWANSVTVTHDY